MKFITKIIAAIACLLPIISLFSCHRIAGNDISYYRLKNVETNAEMDKMRFYGTTGYIAIDLTEKTFSYPPIAVESQTETDNDSELYDMPLSNIEDYAVFGGTAPRYALEASEGNEKIIPHLMDLHIPNNENSVIFTQGYSINGKIYGICNVFYDTIGYLSGGGNYGIEEIAFSVYYEYTADADEFVVLRKTENAFFVAFSGENVVYWQNRKFYVSDDVSENFLCDDLAYDGGLRHQSRNTVYFTDKHVIFEMIKGKSTYDVYHMLVYDFEGKTLTELVKV